jgi:hypothetical protein
MSCSSRVLSCYIPLSSDAAFQGSWGEESVCFRCNQTALSGVSASRPGAVRNEWYCQKLGCARYVKGQGVAMTCHDMVCSWILWINYSVHRCNHSVVGWGAISAGSRDRMTHNKYRVGNIVANLFDSNLFWILFGDFLKHWVVEVGQFDPSVDWTLICCSFLKVGEVWCVDIQTVHSHHLTHWNQQGSSNGWFPWRATPR